MKKLTAFLATLAMMCSLSSQAALIQTATGSIDFDGSLIYDPTADDSDWDSALGTDDWNWLGRMTLTPNLVGIPPDFDQVATWDASVGVEFDYAIAGSTDMLPSFTDSDSGMLATGWLPLGTFAADDIFAPSITSYNDVLLTLLTSFTSTPSLTDIFLAVDAMVLPDLSGMIAGVLPPTLLTDLTDIANGVYFGISGGEILFGSTSGDLILGTTTINDVNLNFAGSAALRAQYTAVPSPAALSLFAIGLIALALPKVRRGIKSK